MGINQAKHSKFACYVKGSAQVRGRAVVDVPSGMDATTSSGDGDAAATPPPAVTPPPPRFTFAELFSGVGGFRLGLEAIGGRCVFACEYCKFAKATYRLNWPSDPSDFVVGDVCRQSPATIPPADVLVAGFPCQSFSNAGRKLAFDDDRGQLFYELVRLATACRFRALLLENVRGLLEPSVMAAVVRALAAAGYTVATREFDAASLLPQRRRRVFLACFRDQAAARAFAWPALPALRRCAYDVLHAAGALPADLALPDAKWARPRGHRAALPLPLPLPLTESRPCPC